MVNIANQVVNAFGFTQFIISDRQKAEPKLSCRGKTGKPRRAPRHPAKAARK